MRISKAALVGVLSLFAVACDGGDPSSESDANCEDGKCDDANGDGDADAFVRADYCVGVRGNGQLITAHFASLARIIEHYGLTAGVSGGSSASITSFLLESIQMNPTVTQCGDEPCSDEEAANRAALLFKSLQGYVDVLAGTPEAAAIAQLAPLAQQIGAQDFESLAESDPQGAAEAMQALLESSDLRELVNPELLALLQESPDPQLHVQDIAKAIAGAANFSADDPAIMVRPGLIDFAAFAEKIGRVGSFYAGYGNYDAEAFEGFMTRCATPGRGMNWDEVSQLSAEGATCGETFNALATKWRDDFVSQEDIYASRIDDAVGAELPALISTSVITGPSVEAWSRARDAYFAGASFELGVSFDDVRFGYFGAADDLERARRNPSEFDDIKTDKFLAIGEASWRTALSYSPAEPGLSRALELPNNKDGEPQVSAGGWSDLHPTLALHNMGCNAVVYVTRTDVDLGGFADGVATLLGMDEATQAALYDLDQDSSIARSIQEADAVWCTNWNDIPATDIRAISRDAYGAPLITEARAFTRGAQAYEGIDPEFNAVGCSIE